MTSQATHTASPEGLYSGNTHATDLDACQRTGELVLVLVFASIGI
jgi:hypothetical protein